jgi:hypothetical protein
MLKGILHREEEDKCNHKNTRKKTDEQMRREKNQTLQKQHHDKH